MNPRKYKYNRDLHIGVCPIIRSSRTDLKNEDIFVARSFCHLVLHPRLFRHLLIMAPDAQSFDEKKDLKFETSSTDKIEDLAESEHAQHLAQLSSIEATAASRAAWLISITVSLGGLLFGTTTKLHH